MSKADRRLARTEAQLEQRFGNRLDLKAREREAELEREARAWEILLPTMGEYSQRVYDEFMALTDPGRDRSKTPDCSAVTFAAMRLTKAVSWTAHRGPIALPPEICRIIEENPGVNFSHQCGDCGLPIPVKPLKTPDGDPIKDRSYFTSCPHCGGTDLGNSAYFLKQGKQLPRTFV